MRAQEAGKQRADEAGLVLIPDASTQHVGHEAEAVRASKCWVPFCILSARVLTLLIVPPFLSVPF